MTGNFFGALHVALSVEPLAPALETPAGRVLRYVDLDAMSSRFANVLVAEGIQPGDRVLAQVGKSPEALALYLGCLRAGAVFAPLNTAYVAAEVPYFISDAEPALVLCQSSAEQAFAGLGTGLKVLTLDEDGGGTLAAAAGTRPFTTGWTQMESHFAAALCYTSGTTGRPKGALLTHGNLLAGARTLVRAWGFRRDDVLLHVLPIFHVHGLFVAAHCALLSGCRMLFLSSFDPVLTVGMMPRCTVMMGVPTHYVRLLDAAGLNAEACRNMRLFVSGSAPLRESDFVRFRERTGHDILERYGMTETLMNASNPLHGERRPGSVGPALEGVEMRVTGPDGASLPPGSPGLLEVRGPNVFKGYWRRPETNRREFRDDGYFITGDIAAIDPDGYVRLVSRARDLVISGGLNVYPREVESVVDAVPGVWESAVVGAPHPDLGEGVIAVVAREEGKEVTVADVVSQCAERLAGFKRPKRVFFTDALPRNALGKVRKDVLRGRFADAFSSEFAS